MFTKLFHKNFFSAATKFVYQFFTCSTSHLLKFPLAQIPTCSTSHLLNFPPCSTSNLLNFPPCSTSHLAQLPSCSTSHLLNFPPCSTSTCSTSQCQDAQSPSITTNYQLPIRLQNIKERKEMEKTLELAKKWDVVHIYFETTTTSRNWIKICIAISYSLIKGILFLNKTK